MPTITSIYLQSHSHRNIYDCGEKDSSPQLSLFLMENKVRQGEEEKNNRKVHTQPPVTEREEKLALFVMQFPSRNLLMKPTSYSCECLHPFASKEEKRLYKSRGNKKKDQ